MLPGEHFGGRHQHDLLPDGPRPASMAYTATIVLPLPTSPCNRRFIGWGRLMSAAISAIAWFCPAVSSNGNSRRMRASILPVSSSGEAGQRIVDLPTLERQCQLQDQQLLIDEPPPGRCQLVAAGRESATSARPRESAAGCAGPDTRLEKLPPASRRRHPARGAPGCARAAAPVPRSADRRAAVARRAPGSSSSMTSHLRMDHLPAHGRGAWPGRRRARSGRPKRRA